MTIRPSFPGLILLGALALTACAAPYAKAHEIPSGSGLPIVAGGGENAVGSSIDEINARLDSLESAVRQGDYARAEAIRSDVAELYESRLEAFLDSHDPGLAHQIEGVIGPGDGSLAALIAAKAPPEQIAASVDHLREGLTETSEYASTSVTGTLAAFNSAAIILREGLEAVLIIAVILGYMRTTKRDPKYGRLVYLGVAAAILLSIATWWASASLFSAAAISRPLMEGLTSLIAVAVLFYCTNWLFHKAYVVDWMTFVRHEAGKALAAGSVIGLVGLGFTVVYREGFETVLFYQAMLFNSDPAPVIAGLAAGAAILVIVAFGVMNMSVRLPVRPFFSVTGALMLILAFKFVGLGIHELQAGGLIGATAVRGMADNAILREVLGIYPVVETLAAQAVLLIATGATFAISRWQWQRRSAPAEIV